MTPRTFVKLAIAAAVTTVAAMAVYAANAPWSEIKVNGQKLAPSLNAAAGKVGSIVITERGSTLTLVATKDNRWTIKERADYPAEAEPIRTLLTRLADAEKVEAKTRNPERHTVLDVEAPGKDAKSKGVKLLDAKAALLADIVIGKRKPEAFGAGKTGTYVRTGTDAQVWLVNVDLDAPADVKRWIKPGIFETDGAKLADVKVEITGEAPLEISRVDGKLAFKGGTLGDGKKLKDAGAAEVIARAAAQFEADDVRRLDQTPAGHAVSTVSLKGDKGLDVVLRLRREGEAAWVSVTAAGDGDAKATADAITAKTRGWEFKIPTGKADAILKKRADLVE